MFYKCSVCGNDENNESFVAKEMMFGLRHRFNYFKCAQCGCLQIGEIPGDMSVYYPENYYSLQSTNNNNKKSFKSKIADYLLSQSLNYQIGNKNITGWFAQHYNPSYYKDTISWMDNRLSKELRIVDVGCGAGLLLFLMKDAGFKNLTGVDPYLPADIHKDGVSIYSKDVFELEGEYDYIMLHHSFEHMPYPHKVIARLYSLLAKDGTLLIRVPVVDSYAWRKYGIDWFQVDAPRHFFLHTVKSINMLAVQHGFLVDRVFYDSLLYQLTISEKYIRDITFFEDVNLFTPEEEKRLKEKANQLNASLDGDRACFYLKKK